MSPDDHVTFTAFEATRSARTIRYGENGIINAVREYVAGYRDALERLADAASNSRGAASDPKVREAVEHARRILEAGR